MIGFLLAFSGVSAYAVPSLGVATEFAYIGETGQTSLEDYQEFFVNTFIPGTSETHGFLIGSSGQDLIVFTDILDADIYLLTTDDVESENDPILGGSGLEEFSIDGTQFNGYKPLPYWGVNLGPVDGDWYELTGFPSSHTFSALNVMLTYTGTIDPSSYFFAVADTNNNCLLETNPDPFSPMTDSAVGNPVPEPSTILLFSSGLIGLAGLRRRFRKS